jgi:opacity protein-like surface antigen
MFKTRSRAWRAGAAVCALGIAVPAGAQAQQTINVGPPTVRAERIQRVPEPDRSANRGLQFGARAGYSTGAGILYSGIDIRDASWGMTPVFVDIGLRPVKELYLGVYGSFAPMFLKTSGASCPEAFTCSAQNLRAGVELDLHVAPHTRFDPYVGVGAGYEVLQTSVMGPSTVPSADGTNRKGAVEATVTDRGWELASLTLGFDYRIADFLGLGPFATATVGGYTARTGTMDVTVNQHTVTSPAPAVSHGTHELFMIGLRGTMNP